MNKYLRQPDGVIDLHGRTTAESEDILRDIFKNKKVDGKSGSSHVRIIVGKGNHSNGKPILRDFVKNYLTAKNIRYTQSKIQDGGEGAIEAYF